MHSMYCICTGERFLEDCFYYYSQQVIPAVANVSIISYSFIETEH